MDDGYDDEFDDMGPSGPGGGGMPGGVDDYGGEIILMDARHLERY